MQARSFLLLLHDNISYADVDFFYGGCAARSGGPDPPFTTLAVPKTENCSYTIPSRQQGQGERVLPDGMTRSVARISHLAFLRSTMHSSSPKARLERHSQTGWETFLGATIRAGFAISGTWPIRTELGNRILGQGTNTLASSIVLVCRRRPDDAPTATRREFITALRSELPRAIAHLQRSNIAPVDLDQAAIGPGMAVYTWYSEVLDAEGCALTVSEALALFNQTLDECCRAGGRIRRRYPLGAGVVRAVRFL